MKGLVAALVLCVACGGADGPRRGGAGSANSLTGRRIRGVSIAGNEAFEDREIIGKLAHRPRRGLPLFRKHTYYDPFALRVDVNRIEAFYRERGYFSASADASVRAVRGRQLDVKFEVIEGPPTKVVSMNVRGVPEEERAAIDELVDDSELRGGTRFVHPSYLDLKDAVVRALVRRGYAHAEVRGEIEVDIERAEAAIDLEIDPGPLVRFGNVVVTGNERISTEVILRRLAWEPGDRFDPERIRLTRRRLTELGVFGTIRIEYSRIGRPAYIETEIFVTEAKRHEVKLGGGFGADNSRYEIRARAGYSIKSWLHPLVSLRTDARLGYVVIAGETDSNALIGEGEVAVARQDLVVPRLRLGLAGFLERDVFEAYDTFGPGARVALDRPFGDDDRVHVSLGWQIRYLDISADSRIENALGIQGPYRLAFYEQSISYDGRDDRFVPRRGVFLDLRAEQGGSFSGSAFDYLRITPDARLYLPLGPFVFASRVRVGWLDSLGDGPTPLTRRYFAGGSSSHRGFNFRKLSPTASDNNGKSVPIGADATLESSVELRFELPWDSFRGVMFLDGGDATEAFEDLDVGNLHWAVGGGIRIDTIVGPGRLDVAYRLNRTGNSTGIDRFAFHLSLGEAF